MVIVKIQSYKITFGYQNELIHEQYIVCESHTVARNTIRNHVTENIEKYGFITKSSTEDIIYNLEQCIGIQYTIINATFTIKKYD